MRIRKHFRTSESIVDLLIMDIMSNKIIDKEMYFNYCVNERLNLLHKQYDEKLDKITSFIIRNYNYYNLPLDSLARVVMSISKITTALTKGLITLVNRSK